MAVYTCPTCGEKMERDLLLFSRHTDAHIVDEIKKKHPAWITEDGFCQKCLDHYKQALTGKADELSRKHASMRLVNIGTREGKKRLVLGASAIAAAVLVFFGLYFQGGGKNKSLVLLPFFFGAALCFLEARRNLCIILSAKGTRNMDEGEQKIVDREEAGALRREAVKVVFLSLLLAVVATWIGSIFL